MTLRTLIVRGTVLVASSALLATGVASAAWTKPGTGVGGGASTSLSAPTGVNAATVAPSSSAIDVSFTPATNPSGATYTVTRDKTKSGAAGPQVACTGLTGSPCHDTGLSSGTTFTYTITAVLGANWVKAALTSPSATTTAAFAITSDVQSGNKFTFSGTGSAASGNVQVVVCDQNVFPCTGAHIKATVTYTPSGSGNWGPTSPTGNLSNNATLYAQATQGATTSAVFTFAT